MVLICVKGSATSLARQLVMRILTCIFLLFCLFSPATVYAQGAGDPYASSRMPVKQKDRKAAAESSYKKGNRYRDKALKYEKKAAKATEEKKAYAYLMKARDSYVKSIQKYVHAINIRTAHYQAHSSLGFVLRKIGDYEASLKSYDRAIQIKPDFSEAIEYRAETCLKLKQFEEVKKAYTELLSDHPREYAEQLMKAMKSWQKENGEAASEAAKEFSNWIQARQ